MLKNEKGLFQPLQGVKVLDLGRLLPAPYATMLLADLGAEVIKIETRDQGDVMRGLPLMFEALSRNKRSVVLDLKQQSGREICLRLAQQCDVLVESFRPGMIAALGLGYKTVSAENPRIVYASVTGWGQNGPLHGQAGHDLNYLSIAGVLGVTGRNGEPAIPGVQIADLGGGLLAALGIVSAVLRSRLTGEGAYLDIAMFDLLVSWLSIPATQYLSGGGEVGFGNGTLSGGFVCYNVYKTADDRWISIGALEPKFWSSFCAAVGRPELEKSAFQPAQSGVDAYEAVVALFRERSRDEWEQLGKKADCCLTPVLSLAEAMLSEQLSAREMLWRSADERFSYPAHPLTDGVTQRGRGPGPAPALGADTLDVLKAMGITGPELDKLQLDGVIQLSL